MAAESNSPVPASDPAANAKTEEALRPFLAASAKYLEANASAREAVFKQQAQAQLDIADNVRDVEQEAQRAVAEATRRHVDQIGQQGPETLEERNAARAQAQLDYEQEVRQIYADTQAKLKHIAEQSAAADEGDALRQFAGQRQDAYQTYLADLQQAWSGTTALDPQTMQAIAANILFTISSG